MRKHCITMSGYVVIDGLPVSIVGPFETSKDCFLWYEKNKAQMDETGGDSEITVMLLVA